MFTSCMKPWCLTWNRSCSLWLQRTKVPIFELSSQPKQTNIPVSFPSDASAPTTCFTELFHTVQIQEINKLWALFPVTKYTSRPPRTSTPLGLNLAMPQTSPEYSNYNLIETSWSSCYKSEAGSATANWVWTSECRELLCTAMAAFTR